MKIVDVFDSVSQQMQTDLKEARAVIEHAGVKGGALEESFRTFLRKYLPRSLDVSTGILVDSTGNVSRQLDVIISDASKTPIFYQKGDVRVIPCECAYAAVEVKTKLGPAEVTAATENMRSVKALQKSAYVGQNGMIKFVSKLYGRECDIWPTMYFVFAFESLQMEPVFARHIETNHLSTASVEAHIDAICVLGEFVIFNKLSSGLFDALPAPGSTPVCLPTERSLLFFFTLLSTYFNQARMPHFNFLPYLGNMEFGETIEFRATNGEHPQA